MSEWYTMLKGGKYAKTIETRKQSNRSIIITIDNIRYVTKKACLKQKPSITTHTRSSILCNSEEHKEKTIDLFQNQIDHIRVHCIEEPTPNQIQDTWKLIRHKRHFVFRRHMNGRQQTMTMAKTPSDYRSRLNFNATMKRLTI